MTPGRLYLFLHGLTIIKEVNNQFEIALPNVPGHVYKAGSWLAETTIANGATLTLTNVKGGNASIRGTGFLIDVPQQYQLNNNLRVATLTVPKAKEVLGLLRALKSGRLIANPPGTFQDLADVLVLVYDYPEENEVFLNDHYWQPSVTGGAISLHVIATSEVMEGDEHEVQTQAALKQVFSGNFPGIEYVKTRPRPLVAEWMDPKPPQHFGHLNDTRPGVGANARRRLDGSHVVEENNQFAFTLAELEHPASRIQRLNRLGRMYQQKRSIEGLWHRPDPLDTGDASACGSFTN